MASCAAPAPPLAQAAAQPPRAKAARLPCPEGMALIETAHSFCIDRYEASLLQREADGKLEPWPGNRRIDGRESEMLAASRPHVTPQGYINGLQARTACENAGKRLCAPDEWDRACRGPQGTLYPYGNVRRAG